MILSGYIFQFDFFLKTTYTVLLSIFMTFHVAMTFLGFALSTTLKTSKSGYTASYAFFLIGLVLQLLMSSEELFIVLHMRGFPTWVYVIRFILSMYPGFNFSKMLIDVSKKSAHHFEHSEGTWVAGSGFTWYDFYQSE